MKAEKRPAGKPRIIIILELILIGYAICNKKIKNLNAKL
jgi:hypothetical protein